MWDALIDQKDTIIVSVITAVLTTIATAAVLFILKNTLLKLFKFIGKKIRTAFFDPIKKKMAKSKEIKARDKRLKTGKPNMRDWLYLQDKITHEGLNEVEQLVYDKQNEACKKIYIENTKDINFNVNVKGYNNDITK